MSDNPGSMTTGDDFLVDSYRRWVGGESVPLHQGFAVDLTLADVSDWPRFGTRGAVVNVSGRGDFLDLWLLEISPGRASELQRHLFEAVGYVVSGHGRTVIEVPGQKDYTIDWGPRSIFSIPLNARYRITNTDARQPARVALTTSFPIMQNILHNADFIFGCDFDFNERVGPRELYAGIGLALSHETAGITRDFWQTNFVADLASFDRLSPMKYRGKGKAVRFLMADSALHGHVSEIPAGAYKKAHRHMGGSHIYSVTGQGYSLLWYEGDRERTRIDWHHGVVHSPPDNMYHQHFNLGAEPARYFAVKMGNYRYPVTSRMDSQMRASLETKRERRDQIEYEDEDPAIRELYERLLAARRETTSV